MESDELRERWRRRVAEAKLHFEAARNHTNGVVRTCRLDGTSSDGRYAYHQAIRQENASLVEYNRVRRIYTNLVIRGIAPDEDEWRGAGSSSTD